MVQENIEIYGARVHNLKNIDVVIPRDQLVVITGLSGSGKSSLAFDTIYAEGQRRYVESLSAYARQFLGQMEKPDVDRIEGLSPAISIDQKSTSRNPRSTVGTITEIYDYFRLLFARVGQPHCPEHGIPIRSQTIPQMVDRIIELPERSRIQVIAPLVKGRKGEHQKKLQEIRKEGFVRVRVDGEIRDLSEEIQLEKNKKHTIEVIVDRLILKEGIETRLTDSLEIALQLSDGDVLIDVIGEQELKFSQNYACPECGFSMDELTPRMFSFNNPFGACPTCDGLGTRMEIDPQLVVNDPHKSLREGALGFWSSEKRTYYFQMLTSFCKAQKIDMDCPYEDLPAADKKKILYGSKQKFLFEYESESGFSHRKEVTFEGLIPQLKRRHRETNSDMARDYIEGYMVEKECSTCNGDRLRQESLHVLINQQNITALTRLSIQQAHQFFTQLQLTEKEYQIARLVLREIKSRLQFLIDVGLDYLTLHRAAATLSGGEAQRIRLATQIGSSLMGVLYILDEPSIGLHQRDNARLIATMEKMRDLGNTLIVVEHDEDTMRAADYLIDVGPGAGVHGGQIIAIGTPEEVMKHPKSLTGQYLSRRKEIPIPEQRRKPNGKWLEIVGAAENNLKNVHAKVPLGLFTCVTGVSGSGKSTLVNEILLKALSRHLYRSKVTPGKYRNIKGLEHIDKVIDINQAPIGRTPRSNPATYTGVFDDIRSVFASTPEAKVRGYQKGRFSFNVKGGRCEACRGDGIIKIEMHFLPDVYVPCEECNGKRYNRDTLQIKYKGKTIADVLDLTVEDALVFFEAIPRINRKLQTLVDVGLGYVKLGQPATTLSGGEAQRVKLASELYKRSTGRTLYILDEPTTGLHMEDVARLLKVLERLVESGESVLVIEHNLDVIKTADHVIDLGPEGGTGGGMIVAEGTPEQIIQVAESHTGHFLAPVLASNQPELVK
ncbi:excinuclease ABC subunit A [Seinonella peptonophila]|uniref:UvrABC system protein A n=1 Tax=Seinonella peptonophila TaxID=112248 RepID=A0A1M4XNY9_9BACL|nr:excinuclease ABC subunit UvrA [Seinonella peptonophila]SHE95314.1 excinuclease ABC subunit A [Seinonella peptonophila]